MKPSLANLPLLAAERIADQLEPIDLLRLSRTSRALRCLATPRRLATALLRAYDDDAIAKAIACGLRCVATLDKLLEALGPYNCNLEHAGRIAGLQNDREMLERWAQAYGRIPQTALIGAAAAGHLELVDFISNRILALDDTISAALLEAAANGHIDVVRSCIDRFSPTSSLRDRSEAVRLAAFHGQDDVVRLLLNSFENAGQPLTRVLCHAAAGAAESNRLDRLAAHLAAIDAKNVRRDFELSNLVLAAAAKTNNLDALRMIDVHLKSPPDVPIALSVAVEHGNWDAFKYLVQTRPTWIRHVSILTTVAINHNRSKFLAHLHTFIDPSWCDRAHFEHAIRTGDLAKFNLYAEKFVCCRTHHIQSDWVKLALVSGHLEIAEAIVQRHAPSHSPPVTALFSGGIYELPPSITAKLLQQGLAGYRMRPEYLQNICKAVATVRCVERARTLLLLVAKWPFLQQKFHAGVNTTNRYIYANALHGAAKLARDFDFDDDGLDLLDRLKTQLCTPE